MGEDGYIAFIEFIACNPEAGDVMSGTGGFRKLRFKRDGMGKSGWVRVVYFFYTTNKPIMLFMIYAKNNADNLTDSQKKWLYQQAKILQGE